jgi:hypothetical protein
MAASISTTTEERVVCGTERTIQLGDYATVEVTCSLDPHEDDPSHQAIDRPNDYVVVIFRWTDA